MSLGWTEKITNEKTFRDHGSGLMTTEKEDFIVIYGDN